MYVCMYRGRNPFEGLPRFKGSAEGNSPRLGPKIQEDPKRVSFPNMMNFFEFQEYYETEGAWKLIPSISWDFWNFEMWSSGYSVLGDVLNYAGEI